MSKCTGCGSRDLITARHDGRRVKQCQNCRRLQPKYPAINIAIIICVLIAVAIAMSLI